LVSQKQTLQLDNRQWSLYTLWNRWRNFCEYSISGKRW